MKIDDLANKISLEMDPLEVRISKREACRIVDNIEENITLMGIENVHTEGIREEIYDLNARIIWLCMKARDKIEKF